MTKFRPNFIKFAHPNVETDQMRLLLLSIILMAAALLLLCVRVLFVRGGRFPSSHIHDNEALRQRGLDCINHSNESK